MTVRVSSGTKATLLIGLSVFLLDKDDERHLLLNAADKTSAGWIAHAIADQYDLDMYEAESAWPSTPKLVERALGIKDIAPDREAIVNEVADRLNEWLGFGEPDADEISIIGKIRSFATA